MTFPRYCSGTYPRSGRIPSNRLPPANDAAMTWLVELRSLASRDIMRKAGFAPSNR
jgi:hypothetical protein